MLPFLFGIMVPILLGSLAIVSWAIATSEPAPDEDTDLLSRMPGSSEASADAQTEVERTKSDPASAPKVRKIG
jgi:hypothetical protein